MFKYRLIALAVIILGLGAAYFSFAPAFGGASSVEERFPLELGLDLQGGTHLIYNADVSEVPPREVDQSMAALRDVIERRVNLFGVSEPLVQTAGGGVLSGNSSDQRLIVELPGVTNVDEATELIGQTPVLEFKTLREDGGAGTATSTSTTSTSTAGTSTETAGNTENGRYVTTELTGRFLDGASLRFSQLANEPTVVLEFNARGSELFAQITEENVGEVVAIFLDGAPISTPVVNEAITGGEATISGNFTPEEARTLVGRLNSGALPVPIELLSSQAIGATLGATAFEAGVTAGIVGLLGVAIFLVLWYRLPGFLAVISLGIYVSTMVALFKLIPVTLTAAGIAGLVLSLGLAVDANILIFERMKEELRSGKKLREAIDTGFKRAWPSIRDGNFTSILTAIILFWFGTSLVEGFALVFGLGVILSMLSAITITRTLLFALGVNEMGKTLRFLFQSGLTGITK